MSHERDYSTNYHYTTTTTPPRSLRSPAPSQEMTYTGQGGHTRLPSIASVFPTSRSPAPNAQHSTQYSQPRPYAPQHEYGVPAYPNDWLNPPTSNQPYGTYPPTFEEPQPRLASSYYTSQSSRSAVPTPSYEARNYATTSGNTATNWDERHGATYGAASPQPSTSSYGGSAATYDSRYHTSTTPPYTTSSYPYPTGTEGSSAYTYAYTPAYAPRASSSSQASFTSASLGSGPSQPPTAPPRSVPSAARGGSRAHTRTQPLFAPYTPYIRHVPRAPTSSTAASTIPVPRAVEDAATAEEPVKKKRKRADATQLKVLNEVYERNPFPPTAEREALAVQLRMTPRSVQIWFQNKRQAQRQGGRGSAAAPTPGASTPSGMVATGGVSGTARTASTSTQRQGSTSSLAHAVAVPSSTAPRGAPGYVASPPRELYASSPPMPGPASIPRVASPSSRSMGSVATSETFSTRRSTSRNETRDPAAYYPRSTSRLR